MANSTKIAIVGMMILLVVVVAKFVKNGSGGDGKDGSEVAAGLASPGSSGNGGGANDEAARLAEKSSRKQDPAAHANPGNQGRNPRVAARTETPKPSGGSADAGKAGPAGNRGAQEPRAGGLQPPLRVDPGWNSREDDEARRRQALNPGGGAGSGARVPGNGGAGNAGGDFQPLVRTELGENGSSVTTTEGDVRPPLSKDAKEALEREREMRSKRDERDPAVAANLIPSPGGGVISEPGRTPGSITDPSNSPGPSSPSNRPIAGTTSEVPSKLIGDETPSERAPTPPARAVDPRAGGAAGASGRYPLQHTIVKNDSPWKLAMRYYGSATPDLCEHLVTANKGVPIHPGKSWVIPAPPASAVRSDRRTSLNPGTSSGSRPAVVPTPARDARPATSSTGDRWYVVKKGDSLSKIAREQLGDEKLFVKIAEANPELDLEFRYILPGMKLRLPKP